MKKLNLFIYLFYAFALANFTNAQTLSLEECIKTGLENSKSLSLSNSTITISKEKIKEVGASKLPQLKFFASYSRLSDIPNSEIKLPFLPNPVVLQEPILNSYGLRLNVTQPLFLGHKITSSEKSAENSVEGLKADNSVIVNDETIKIIVAYYNVSTATELLQIIKENETLLQKRLTDANDFFKNGLLTRNDILKIEVQISNLRSKKIDAETAISSAKAQLNFVMGRSVNSPIEIDNYIFNEEATSDDFETLKQSAETNRGEFKSIAIKKQVLEENLNIVKSAFLPEVYLSSNLYLTNPTQRIFPQKDEFRTTWDVSLNLQWTVWDWGITSAKAEQVSESINSLSTTKQQLADAISNEVYQNYLFFKSAIEKLPNLQTILDQATENYRVTLENFNGQIATATDLLDADAILFSAKSNLQSAKISIVIARYKLYKSTGKKLF
jgi:outer membrane protein TolC